MADKNRNTTNVCVDVFPPKWAETAEDELREQGVENWYLFPEGNDTIEWIETLGTII